MTLECARPSLSFVHLLDCDDDLAIFESPETFFRIGLAAKIFIDEGWIAFKSHLEVVRRDLYVQLGHLLPRL